MKLLMFFYWSFIPGRQVLSICIERGVITYQLERGKTGSYGRNKGNFQSIYTHRRTNAREKDGRRDRKKELNVLVLPPPPPPLLLLLLYILLCLISICVFCFYHF